MTFTEAAVDILRRAGRPLHYKKIAELAIEQNLLSHVGKTPEITMSARLATMVKKDRGEAPIVKVKPGVFSLREFASVPSDGDNLAADLELAEEPAEDLNLDEVNHTAGTGIESAPPMDEDDEPIFAGIDKGESEGRGRRRRSRGSRSESRGDRSDRRETSAKNERSKSRESASTSKRNTKRSRSVDGEWTRSPEDQDELGRSLTDAIFELLDGHGEPQTLKDVATKLVAGGKLTGNAAVLAPTLASAVRGEIARCRAESSRPRFAMDGDEVSLGHWTMSPEALKQETDLVRQARKYNEVIHADLLSRLEALPLAGFAELMASWLNAEGVSGLRAVVPPNASSGELHLVGLRKTGPLRERLAIVLLRGGAALARDSLIAARGALHHYDHANAVWMVTTGKLERGVRDEAEAPGQVPCAVFDGPALCEALHRVGVGLRRYQVEVVTLDGELFSDLGAPLSPHGTASTGASGGAGDGGRRRRRRRRGGSSSRTSRGRDSGDGQDSDDESRQDASGENRGSDGEHIDERAARHTDDPVLSEVSIDDRAANVN